MLLLPVAAVAQTDSTDVADTDTVISRVVKDTTKNKFIPTGIRVGTDVISLVKSSLQDDFQGWEVNAEMDVHRYFLAFESGRWARDFAGDSAHYTNDGSYWRAGVDVNFLRYDPQRNVFFIGFRYARGKFSDNFEYITLDPVWGAIHGAEENTDARARWMELTTGIRVKIWSFLWLGYTGRLKFGLKTFGTDSLFPHDVPGFGKTFKETYWGFNYQVLIRLPIRKAPPVPPPPRR